MKRSNKVKRSSTGFFHLLFMKNKGNPYDNAFVESFIRTLKYEEVYLNGYLLRR